MWAEPRTFSKSHLEKKVKQPKNGSTASTHNSIEYKEPSVSSHLQMVDLALFAVTISLAGLCVFLARFFASRLEGPGRQQLSERMRLLLSERPEHHPYENESTEEYINLKGYVVLSKTHEPKHRAIAKQILGRELKSNEVVHHIDGNKRDNGVKNLCVMDREKHEFFHSWLAWKKGKIGNYPSPNDQRRALVNEYGGILLENVKSPMQLSAIDEVQKEKRRESLAEDEEIFVIRKNKRSGKMFVEFDDRMLISPDGKEINLDYAIFAEPEEVPASELTEMQRKVCRTITNAREKTINRDQDSANRQRKLFAELRRERKKIADEKGVPAYIVFDDKTLIEMAEVMPISETLMSQVRGVGPEKVGMYGQRFIEVVKNFKRIS